MRIRAFQGLVPKPALAAEVACVPYDVVNTSEAAALAAGKPHSLLHVDRAEIAFPAGADPYSDKVYAKALEMFQKLQRDGALVRETEPCVYVYQQQMGAHTQRGIVALTNVEDYDAGLIKKHEKTRRDKEDDRTRLIDTISANTGPVFLTYRDAPAVTALVNAKTREKPLHDFTAPDGIRHTFWRVGSVAQTAKSASVASSTPVATEADLAARKVGGASLLPTTGAGSSRHFPISADLAVRATSGAAVSAQAFVAAFGAVPALYIADGHHRAASAARVARLRRERNAAKHTGAEDYNWFLSVIFPASELKIMPYNRIVFNLNGHTPVEFLAEVKKVFGLEENAKPSPDAVGRVSMYLNGKWHGLRCPAPADPKAGPVDRLDVSVLQNKLLAPILGIDDPRTSKRIDFVGGIRGTAELVKRVDADGGVAFSMFPVTLNQLMDIADAGEIMPPKSTWFEPKLRSGLAVHVF